MNKYRTGRSIGVAAWVITAVVFGAAPLAAHHTWSSYAGDRTFSVTGKVVRIEWTNPHSHLYVDVQDTKAGVTHWAVETGPVSALVKNGWDKDTLKAGDEVSVKGFPDKANDGKGLQHGLASVVTFAGKKFLIGIN